MCLVPTEEGIGSFGTGLEILMNHHVGAGNQTSERAAEVLMAEPPFHPLKLSFPRGQGTPVSTFLENVLSSGCLIMIAYFLLVVSVAALRGQR